jgi:hypothetical protein
LETINLEIVPKHTINAHFLGFNLVPYFLHFRKHFMGFSKKYRKPMFAYFVDLKKASIDTHFGMSWGNRGCPQS